MTAVPKKLRSAVVKDGPDRGPHRAFPRAVGMADEDFDKPLVAIEDDVDATARGRR